MPGEKANSLALWLAVLFLKKEFDEVWFKDSVLKRAPECSFVFKSNITGLCLKAFFFFF